MFWGYGKNECWYLERVGSLLLKILEKLSISIEDTLFAGSSGGGFTTIALAILLRSKAFTINPQLICTNFWPRIVQVMKNTCLQAGEELIEERVDIAKLAKKKVYLPRIDLMINTNSYRDVKTQLHPFLEELKQLKIPSGNVKLSEYFHGGGHSGMPDKEDCIRMTHKNLGVRKVETKNTEKRPKLYVVITIDTEDKNGAVPHMIECDFGQDGNCGVNYIMSQMEKRNMRGVFFTNIYEHLNYTGEYDGYIENLVKRISSRGHEVGLHHHHQGCKPPMFTKPIYDYSREEQEKVIRYGMNFINKCIGKYPVSFRGGGYSCNDVTMDVLSRLGFKIDSSVYYSNTGTMGKYCYFKTFNQVKKIYGLLEFPVINAFNDAGLMRKLDPNSMTSKEIIDVFSAMKERKDYFAANMMLHSFSFIDQIKNRTDGKSPYWISGNHHAFGVSKYLMNEFETILDYLENDEDIQVVTFEQYLSLNISVPSFWGDGVFCTRTEASRKAAKEFHAVCKNPRSNQNGNENYNKNRLIFDDYKLWNVRNYYNDSEIVRKADDICHGIIHCYKPIPGLKYDIEAFDWGISHSNIPDTFQLYLQSLNPVLILTRAYEFTRNSEYLSFAMRLIQSWKAYSDPEENRKSNRWIFIDHSVSLRANNLIYYGKVCSDAAYWDDGLTLLLHDILEECGEWLADNKNYAKNHNHGIMQDEALLHLGKLLEKNDWVEMGKARLNSQYKYAFAKDNVHVENSPAYHQLVQSMFKSIATWLSDVGDKAPFGQEIVSSQEYLNWVRMPNGFYAQIGDTSGHPGAKYGAKSQMERHTKGLHKMYPDSGIYFYRSRVDEEPSKDTWKTVKAGYTSTTHKHADDGSFILYSKGYEIFTDCGIYGYKKDAFRDYIISAKAHNCVIVDGKSWNPIAENMKKIGVKNYKLDSDHDEVVIFNDAYDGVHIERLFYSVDDFTVLLDTMVSAQEHTYTQVFHLGEYMEIISADSKDVKIRIADSGYVLHLQQHGSPVMLDVYRGDVTKADYGIISRGENHLGVTTTLAFSMKAKNKRFVTTLAVEDQNGKVRLFDRFMVPDSLKYDIKTGNLDWDDKEMPVPNIGSNRNKNKMIPEQNHSMASEYIPELLWSQIYHDTIMSSEWFLDKAISPGGPHRWAAGYNLLYALYRILNEMHPKAILELGLGQSTKLTGQYSRYFGAMHTVVEHDKEWVDFFCNGWNKLSQQTQIRLSELDKVEYAGQKYFAYKDFDKVIESLQAPCELILIDGPFGSGSERARRDIVPHLPNILSEDFVIIIDDCGRKGETNLVQEIRGILSQHKIEHVFGLYKSGGESHVGVIACRKWRFFTTM